MLKLKGVLIDCGLTQADLAEEMKVSPATISLIINKSQWPKSLDKDDLKRRVRLFLTCHGASENAVSSVFDAENPVSAALPGSEDTTNNDQEINDMLLRKSVLSTAAKRAFGLVRDPFGDVQSANEVYMTADARYVRESLRAIARHGGFMAVAGESGAGKSTLRRDLVEWMKASSQPMIAIEPYVLGMEDNDQKGKTLKAEHIAVSILAAIAPGQSIKRNSQLRFEQLHQALRDSHRSGNRHVLIIEEAHSLPIPTLKHLKRFQELEDGFSKLLSIVLFGQTELAQMLDERNPRLREVVQRCELINLLPLDNDLEAYLRHRFGLADRPLEAVMDLPAVEALRVKLCGRNHSVLYPLAVHNVLAAAMNEAAALGMATLSADLIAEV